MPGLTRVQCDWQNGQVRLEYVSAFLAGEMASGIMHPHHDSELISWYHDAFLPWYHYLNNIVLFHHDSPITRSHFIDPTDRAIKGFYCTIFKLCMMKTEVLMQYHTCFLCFCRWQYLLCCGSPPSNGSAGGCAVTKETPASTEVVPGSAAVRLPGTTQQTCGYLLLILGRGYFAGKTEIWMLKKYNANKNM